MEEAKLPEGWSGAEEIETNWKKFNNIGDNIKGTLINKRFQVGEPPFGDQWIYEIKAEDNNIWNVPMSNSKTGTIQRLNSVQLGTIIGIMFESEGPSAIKGGNPSKNYKVVSFGIDENYNEFDSGQDVPSLE